MKELDRFDREKAINKREKLKKVAEARPLTDREIKILLACSIVLSLQKEESSIKTPQK